MEDLVTVVIPSYNRLKLLLNAIESVRKQTYKNMEIIVVNDGSLDQEYYTHNFGEDVKIIHLKKNTREVFGYPCVGHVINIGFLNANGKYIAFLDDDDIWLPAKIEKQLAAMKKTGCKMSATDGLIGKGVFDESKHYPKYNAEYFNATLKQIYRNAHSSYLDNGFPKIWTLDFLKIHDCIIASSVLLEKSIVNIIGPQREIKMGGTIWNGKMTYIDYDYWLRALEYTDCVYLEDILFYYDMGHGDGNLW